MSREWRVKGKETQVKSTRAMWLPWRAGVACIANFEARSEGTRGCCLFSDLRAWQVPPGVVAVGGLKNVMGNPRPNPGGVMGRVI